MIVVAKSKKDHEFLYVPKTAHSVPKSSAKKICDALNKCGYKLTHDEVWYIHEVGPYDDAYYYADMQSFSIRKNSIYEKR